MKRISEICEPREEVFVNSSRDDVLDLSNLVEKNIDVDKFFEETFQTGGMKALFGAAFGRFKGISPTGVIKLTQAMGGGKTHCMLALALLAENPAWRTKLLGPDYDDLAPIRVVAFTGRESDTPFGIWGSIAEQMGKKEFFKDYYAPLKAPGQSAWENLLRGENVLILLDELPPYLENAKSMAVGNSDLSQVTCTALANLFSAVGKEKLAHVCVVFSDLKASYETGSGMLQASFAELEREADRSALDIEPVGLNTDDLYDILKKRLFKKLPSENSADVNDIAIAYKDAVKAARKVNLTAYFEDKVYTGIRESFPFHPSIKDLYARFKENPNFQQTRGMIRLMRQVVRRFYETGAAEKKSLINVFDVDLNDNNTRAHILQIKPSLDVAINHDIAQNGQSAAEQIDKESANRALPFTQNFCKLLLMASLNDVQHGLLGLSEAEALGYLCEPGIELNAYKQAFAAMRQESWYLKADNRGLYYFQNQKNLVAEMNTLIQSYNQEGARRELAKFLEDNFKPLRKCCYQKLYVLPAPNEIKIEAGEVALVLCEPWPGNGLNPEAQEIFENCAYKNRVMFLSGQRALMERLIENSKKLTAIRQILANMKAEHISETDQQFKAAENQEIQVLQSLLSTIRETFINLYFPVRGNKLRNEEFKLEFSENKFKGEDQVIKVLTDSSKFEDWQTGDEFMETLRKKCEARLFTTQEMLWNTILERAATETAWGWYDPKQLEKLKQDCLNKGYWRESGGYLNKGPFPVEPTAVFLMRSDYSDERREFRFELRASYGDTLYWEIGAEPTAASQQVSENFLVTKEPEVYFLCTDSTGRHPTGEVLHVVGKAPLKYEQHQGTQGMVLELRTYSGFAIRYTTDGSNALENGALYNGPISLPEDCTFVNVCVLYKDEAVETRSIYIERAAKGSSQPVIQPEKALRYKRGSHALRCHSTEDVYRLLSTLKGYDARLSDVDFLLEEKENASAYINFSVSESLCTPAALEECLNKLRETVYPEKNLNITLDYRRLEFPHGKDFTDWVDAMKLDYGSLLKDGEVRQDA